MLLLSVVLYLLITVLIGLWASRRVHNTQDFVLAGRKLPFILASTATFATWFGSETVMGASSAFVEDGMMGVIEDPFGAALCLFLVGAFYARTFYRLNILTFCDFFKLRYGKSAEFLGAVLIIPTYFSWIAAQMVAMGIVLQIVFKEIDLNTCIVISAGLTMIYTLTGGLWSVSITDFIQTIIIIVGLLILAIVLYLEVGDFRAITSKVSKGFFRPIPQEFSFKSLAEYLAAWITIGLGSIPQQDIFQRVMAGRSAKVAVQSSYMASFLYLTVALLPLFIAQAAVTLYPDLLKGNHQMIIPTMVLQHTNTFVQIMFFGALISAILSTTSGAILAPSAVLGENLIKPFFPTITDKQLLLSIRISVVVVTLLCIWMATTRQNIYELVGESASFSLVSMFVPLTAGLRWKRANWVGCLASMIGGWSTWIVCQFVVKTELPAILYGLLVGIIAMFIGSWLTPKPTQVQLAFIEQ